MIIPISNPTFNASFTDTRPPEQDFTINYDPSRSGATSVNSHNFTVENGQSVLDVWADTDTIAGAGTGDLIGMAVYDPSGHLVGLGAADGVQLRPRLAL